MQDNKKPTVWEMFLNFNKLGGGIQRIVLDLMKWALKKENRNGKDNI